MSSALDAVRKARANGAVSDKEKTPVTVNEHVLIKHVEVGDTFAGVYYVHAAFEKVARNNNIYSDFTLRDKSGEAFVRHWGDAKGLKHGDWVAILATVGEYQGKPQIVAQQLEPSEPPDATEMANYVVVGPNQQSDIAKFDQYIERVGEACGLAKDATCARLLGAVFTDAFRDDFFNAPNSDRIHDGTVGGLLSHTVKVAYLMGGFGSQYDFDDLTMAISFTVALLHRIGATKAYAMDGCQPTESDVGVMVGVKALTLALVEEGVGKTKKMEPMTLSRIRHAIVSQDWQDVKPMTKEAMVLAAVTRTDLRLTEALDFIAQDTSSDRFTAFHPERKQRYLRH